MLLPFLRTSTIRAIILRYRSKAHLRCNVVEIVKVGKINDNGNGNDQDVPLFRHPNVYTIPALI